VSTVAVVVTCSHEPYGWLTQAVESVLSQTVATRPIIVCDGPLTTEGDSSQFLAAARHADWISAAAAHGDAGDWARSAGALHAAAAGYDAVGFLDGDNWLERDHVEKMLALDVDVATSARFICHADGRVLYVDPECSSTKHVDTSCFLLRRRAFGLLAHWALIPPALSPICDQLFWGCAKAAILEGHLTHAHSPVPTVNFRSRYAAHYHALGIEPPPGSKPNIQLPHGTYRVPWPFEQEVVVD
jgi:hypothetical protein